MSPFQFTVVSPSFLDREKQVSVAAAAARAGALGVVDLEFWQGESAVGAVFDELEELSAAFAFGQLGLRLGLEQAEALAKHVGAVGGSSPERDSQLVAVIYSRKELLATGNLQQVIFDLQQAGLFVAVEVVELEEARLAQSLGAQAVIGKGHESGGRVGETTNFVLIQQLVSAVTIPVWSQGGIGEHTIAAVDIAGASGVVLDSQILLARDSYVPDRIRRAVARMDGTETELLRGPSGEAYRVYTRKGSRDFENLAISLRPIEDREVWRTTVVDFIARGLGWDSAQGNDSTDGAAKGSPTGGGEFEVYPLGQDASLAASLAKQGGTISGIIEKLRCSIEEHQRYSQAHDILGENSPLARANRTRYPIVQGAMTRVSDNADFAHAVADAGALPMLALALSRRAEVDQLLAQTKEKLGDLPWGVGILGFVPEALRNEQLESISQYRPPFAVIAGGRPDQAAALEAMGTRTYLHVPSPLLLEAFIEAGSRSFIFEGKECGGHVGPRTSFVLWEQMIEVILSSIKNPDDAAKYHILYAGGIHDALSASMVAAMSSSLAARGAKVGVLVGTAYLFTKEAVETGAIVSRFQEEALKCSRTALLETSAGHAIRCIDSPYKTAFEKKRRELEEKNLGRDRIREELELMNLGRLRVASKGLERKGAELVEVASDKQWNDGMYMIGQVSSMHSRVLKISELHQNISKVGAEKLSKARVIESSQTVARPTGEPIAIVGMSCFLPGANDVETFWANILNRVDAIEEVPDTHWDWKQFYDSDPFAPDKILSKWGGFLKDIIFDPTKYGIPPNSVGTIDPVQLLALEAVRYALEDAGYANRRFNKQRTAVLMANAGHAPNGAFYALRSMLDWTLDFLDEKAKEHIKGQTPEWTEDSFPGYLSNVAAGRVANRFDVGGVNFCIDAACASSLATLYVGVNELRSGAADLVVLGAVDTHNQPGDYLSFSKTHALSPGGRCRTFDASADGIVLGEGVGVLVIKRLSDAERDGDKIYAVIKGVGGSSDGRDRSLTAPRPEGQMLALERAYADSGVSPSTVSLVEAHGTGTVAGDRAEVAALSKVYEACGALPESCAIGSVKTNIGHTKCTAGAASLVKVAKALYHKVLPPTIGVKVPSPACKFGENPFFVNATARPWVHANKDYPRRAAISAFGFGGTNFHVVLEEHTSAAVGGSTSEAVATPFWPAELFLWTADTTERLVKALEGFESRVSALIDAKAKHLYSENTSYENRLLVEQARLVATEATDKPRGKFSLGLVASSLDDLKEKVAKARAAIASGGTVLKDPKGIFFGTLADPQPAGRSALGLPLPLQAEAGKVAFLFPGQGAQQVDMLKDMAVLFPQMRQQFERADSLLADELPNPLSSWVYPAPAFTDEQRVEQQKRLTATEIAQPAIGVCSLGVMKVLRTLGIKPDAVAGHSYGEYVALCAAGVMSEDELVELSYKRGRVIKDFCSTSEQGAMLAVAAPLNMVREAISATKSENSVFISNINSTTQVIVSGKVSAVNAFAEALEKREISFKRVGVSNAFHSPEIEPAVPELRKALDGVDLKAPAIPVYSNTLACPYPEDTAKIREVLVAHAVNPVRFAEEIEAMYESGVRTFIEVGPGSILTSFVKTILRDRDCVSVPLERNGRDGVVHLLNALAELWAYGVSMKPTVLFEGRLTDATGNATRTSFEKHKLLCRVDSSRVARVDETKRLPYIATGKPTTTGMAKPKVATPASMAAAVPIAPVVATTPVATPGVAVQPASGTSAYVAGPTVPAVGTAPAAASLPTATGLPVRAGLQQPAQQYPQQPAQQHALHYPQQPAQQTGAPLTVPGARQSAPQVPVAPQSASTAASQPVPAAAHQGPIRGNDAERLVVEFQRSMMHMTQSFIDAQRDVMIAYLGTAASGPQTYASQSRTEAQWPQQAVHQVQYQAAPQQPMHTQNPYSAPQITHSVSQPLQSAQQPAPAAQAPQVSPHPIPQQQNLLNQFAQQVSPQSSLEKTEPTNGAIPSNGVAAVPSHTAGSETADSSGDKFDINQLVDMLFEIVSDRTGYPREMLDPNLDLEADLGIDSIKRIEILNNFRKLLPEQIQQTMEASLEELAGIKTLQQLVDWMNQLDAIIPVETIVESAMSQMTTESFSSIDLSHMAGAGNNGSIGKEDSVSGNGGTTAGGNGNGRGGDGHGRSDGSSGNGSEHSVGSAQPGTHAAASPQTSTGSQTHTAPTSTGVSTTEDSIKGGKVVTRGLVKLVEAPASSATGALPERALIVSAGGADPEGLNVLLKRKGIDTELVVSTQIDLAQLEKAFGVNSSDGAPTLPGTSKLPGWVFFTSGTDESLLYLAQQLELLTRVNPHYKPRLIVATGLGGDFGIAGRVADAARLCRQGALAGMAKTIAKELTSVDAFYVDLAEDLTADERAMALFGEALGATNGSEIGYSSGKRVSVEIVPGTIDRERSNGAAPNTKLDANSVILVTGGARGITAEVSLALAQKYRCSFVLVGRSDLPVANESPSTAGLTSARDIKAALMTELTASGVKPKIPEIEKAYKKLLRDREMRDNIARLQKYASSVKYYALDVRDTDALNELIGSIYEACGNIDGVIQGAGVIEDAFIKDKTVDSFRRVVDTKVISALELASALRLDTLKFLFFFSSIVGRTGNQGQVDYVAANEAINKLALLIDKKTTARVASLGWGPWRAGMAQPELEEIFAAYGWSMIDPEAGQQSFLDELEYGRKGEVEVLLVGTRNNSMPDKSAPGYAAAPSIGSPPQATSAAQQATTAQMTSATLPSAGSAQQAGSFAPPQTTNAAQQAGRFALPQTTNAAPQAANFAPSSAGSASYMAQPESPRATEAKIARLPLLASKVIEVAPSALTLRVDPLEHFYLDDHKLDGLPVLPMAAALEIILESVQAIYPNRSILQVTDFDIPAGILFPAGAKQLRVSASEIDESRVRVLIDSVAERPRTHFRATVEFGVAHTAPQVISTALGAKIPYFFNGGAVDAPEKSIPSVEDVYRRWMFHGPIFQGLRSIDALGISGIYGHVESREPVECVKPGDGEWIVDPTMFDSSMQLAGIWTRYYADMTCLPTGIKKLHMLGRFSRRNIAQVFLPADGNKRELRCDLAIYNSDGQLVLLLEELSAIGSTAFNRFEEQKFAPERK